MNENGAIVVPLPERIRASPRHAGGEFEVHLEGTAALLRGWGCRHELQLAGRYHSVYGDPQGREAIASASERELIAEIGEEAEQLVRLWARLDRTSLATAARGARRSGPADAIELSLVTGGTTTVPAQVYRDLVQLHAANELEQATRTGIACRLLDPLRPLLCAEALALLKRKRRPARLAGWFRRLGLAATRAVGAR